MKSSNISYWAHYLLGYVLDYLLRRSRKLVFILTNLTLLGLKAYSVSY